MLTGVLRVLCLGSDWISDLSHSDLWPRSWPQPTPHRATQSQSTFAFLRPLSSHHRSHNISPAPVLSLRHTRGWGGVLKNGQTNSWKHVLLSSLCLPSQAPWILTHYKSPMSIIILAEKIFIVNLTSLRINMIENLLGPPNRCFGVSKSMIVDVDSFLAHYFSSFLIIVVLLVAR